MIVSFCREQSFYTAACLDTPVGVWGPDGGGGVDTRSYGEARIMS